MSLIEFRALSSISFGCIWHSSSFELRQSIIAYRLSIIVYLQFDEQTKTIIILVLPN